MVYHRLTVDRHRLNLSIHITHAHIKEKYKICCVYVKIFSLFIEISKMEFHELSWNSFTTQTFFVWEEKRFERHEQELCQFCPRKHYNFVHGTIYDSFLRTHFTLSLSLCVMNIWIYYLKCDWKLLDTAQKCIVEHSIEIKWGKSLTQTQKKNRKTHTIHNDFTSLHGYNVWPILWHSKHGQI